MFTHASLSRVGLIDGGAAGLLSALEAAVGPSGSLLFPAYTPQVRSDRSAAETVLSDTRGQRFSRYAEPSGLGVLPQEAVRRRDAVRSDHPQVSFVALGALAGDLCGGRQPLTFALGLGSPLDRLVRSRGKVLLLGVGHNRSSLLHHCESLCPSRRLKVRRFPHTVAEEPVVVETVDVADDLDTYFPVVGRMFENEVGCATGTVGSAESRYIDARAYVEFCAPRLEELLTRAQ